MVDSRIKNVSAAFSWADEVEREEEEQARFQEHQKQKPDPFGSARPREVVLLEKGIDWRKLDIHLQQPSHKRQLDPPYGKQCKENIPAFAASGIERIPSVTPSKSLKTELEDANSELKRSEILRVPLATESQIPATFVPPLRYPPKNAIPSLSESGFHYYLQELDKGQHGFQSKLPLKPGKENTFHQQVPQKDRCFQNLNQGSHTHPHYHRQILQAERRSQVEDKISFRLWQSGGSGKNLRKPDASRLQQDTDSATEKLGKNLQGNDAVRQGARQILTKSSCAGGTNIKQRNGLERSVAKRSSGTKFNVIVQVRKRRGN
ncbi:PREDICTED: uncharacterized protein LOC105118383 [Populus euphratica]|uniref:Uncharacterized protein LOC105118383 n=1 Tax=Populus euphratica TaxID=75702 RepID=A0AAJ6XD89_POPEU|nr:PREDICTED: uncharacterized protein LOC105118383 [Populus euphratica]